MEIPKIVRRSRYIIRGLVHLEYPRKSVYDFMKHGSSLKQIHSKNDRQEEKPRPQQARQRPRQPC